MNTRTVFKGIITTLLTMLILWCVAEIYVRKRHPQPPVNHTISTPSLNRGQFTVPGIHTNHSSEYSVQVHVNQYGFVDHEWNLPEPSGTLLIGDSFVQAAQVELGLGLGRQLQRKLNEPVVSIGVPGSGTTTTLLLLKLWLPKIRPKRVLIGILVSNDIMNNHPNLESKTDKPFAFVQNDTLSFQLGAPKSTFFPKALLEHSQSLLWFERKMAKHSQIKEKTKHSAYPVDYGIYLPKDNNKPWEDSWLLTGRLLNEIQRLCDMYNTELYFLMFPSLDEVSTKRQSRIQARYPSLISADFGNPHERLTTIVRSVAVSPNHIVDLYPDFLSHSNPESLYYPIDGHWTELGHALASNVIATQIEAQE